MKTKRALIFALLVILLANCTATGTPDQTPTLTLEPTYTPTVTITPTPTEIPFFKYASVWDDTFQVPILIYHKFVPDRMDTNATRMRLSDFRSQLQQLYDAGFTLISLKDWINGIVDVPEGRKPLILTIDDLWFGDQIYISDDGNPSEHCGIGVLWRFSQEHPDFGFHAALFAIYGDKAYPEKEVGDLFLAGEDDSWYNVSWHIKLGHTIAWALENGLEVYNHTFQHSPEFVLGGVPMTNREVEEQLSKNDYWERQFLTQAGREDLIPLLDNIIALPEGKWPLTESGKQVILDYKNPEGKPVLAILEAYNMDAAQFTPSAYSDQFDPMHIARITASEYMTNYIVENKDLVPTMTSCQLGPMKQEQSADLMIIQSAIQTAINTQTCPEGVYTVDGNIFIAKVGQVTLYDATSLSITPTVTP